MSDDADEYQSLCKRIAALEAHPSRDVACALDLELTTRPELSVRRMGRTTPVGETTINNWISGRSSPTWDSICALARGLHPTGRLGDPIAWLQAGREHLYRLVSRRDEMARHLREQTVTTALRDALDNSTTAETMLAVLRTYPPPVLAKLIELLSAMVEGGEKVTGEESTS